MDKTNEKKAKQQSDKTCGKDTSEENGAFGRLCLRWRHNIARDLLEAMNFKDDLNCNGFEHLGLNTAEA